MILALAWYWWALIIVGVVVAVILFTFITWVAVSAISLIRFAFKHICLAFKHWPNETRPL